VESIIRDLLLIAPLHMTNDLVFLIMRWQLLWNLHKKDSLVSKKLFGTHRTWLGMGVIFALNTIFYLLFTGRLLLLPGIGVVVGVHASSFIKRSLRIREGRALPGLDQLDFVIGGIAGLALSEIYLSNLYLMLAISFAVHLASNMAVYAIGMKEVWW